MTAVSKGRTHTLAKDVNVVPPGVCIESTRSARLNKDDMSGSISWTEVHIKYGTAAHDSGNLFQTGFTGQALEDEPAIVVALGSEIVVALLLLSRAVVIHWFLILTIGGRAIYISAG